MFDRELVRKINRGRCFAFVGAGPSIEVGYPSWRRLAESVRNKVFSLVPDADRPTYERFLTGTAYPELLRQAETDLGGRLRLLEVLKECMCQNTNTGSASMYKYLARWPFAVYLTTNFDDELHKSLRAAGQHFQVVGNTKDDLALLRNGVSHLIVKVHSDLEHPNDVVLTSLDYDRILNSTDGSRLLDRLKTVFATFDIVVVGHSMTDPDVRLALAAARPTASPIHPVFMLLANPTAGEISQYRDRYNIRIIPYELESTEFRPIVSSPVLQSAWSAVSARYSGQPIDRRVA